MVYEWFGERNDVKLKSIIIYILIYIYFSFVSKILMIRREFLFSMSQKETIQLKEYQFLYSKISIKSVHFDNSVMSLFYFPSSIFISYKDEDARAQKNRRRLEERRNAKGSISKIEIPSTDFFRFFLSDLVTDDASLSS